MKPKTARTETELARALGCTRAALHDWRKRFDSAPAGRDVGAWEEFLASNGLGDRAPKRAAAPRGVRYTVAECILTAETALYRAQLLLDERNAGAAKKFKAARQNVADAILGAWRVADAL